MIFDNREISPADAEKIFIPMAENIPSIDQDNKNREWPFGVDFSTSFIAGAYQLTISPFSGSSIFQGTLRVDYRINAISGDLYQLNRPVYWPPVIPVYPRNLYYSYLKVIDFSRLPGNSDYDSGENIKLTVEEYIYQLPPANSFNGSFIETPSRTLTLYLSPSPSPSGYNGPSFNGQVIEADEVIGAVELNWVSSFFRKSTLIVTTFDDAIPPMAVPGRFGTGYEDFNTIMATGGWELDVIYNPNSLPISDDLTTLKGDNCPSKEDLFTLMKTLYVNSNYLDYQWLLQLLVIPSQMGCSRGVLFDTKRRGSAVFSNDGYPGSESEFFGSATDKRQWQVPRAFLRSAAHEMGHGFNLQHQNLTELGEPGIDNSIMTTTPDVAQVIANPENEQQGIFPDDISLSFNKHNRHHLIHFPDPVVRPGGMTFMEGHLTKVPQAN